MVKDQPCRWYPQEALGLASGRRLSHWMGLGIPSDQPGDGLVHGASAEPKGRFRITVKSSTTVPIDHHHTGRSANFTGRSRTA